MRDTDAILWTLDRDPLLRSTIVAIALLDRGPAFERVVEKVAVLCHQRHHFRSVVLPPSLPWNRPRWREDPGFDVASHLGHVRAPLPGDLRGVLDLAQSMAGKAFDPARPLWEALLVDDMTGGRAALIIKVHHSVIDGIGGLQVVASILDLDRDGGPPVAGSTTATVSHRSPEPRALAAARGAVSAPRALVNSIRRVVDDPSGSIGQWVDTLVDSAALVAPSPMPLSPLMRKRSLDRHFETMDLSSDLKHAAERAGLTLNDVFVSGLLRGLSHYHHRHHRPATQLRAIMPISTRRPDDPVETNRFVPARLTLPANFRAAGTYLEEVPRLLARWKHSGALSVSDLLTSALDRLPAPVVVRVFASMLKGVDFTATDVPGPPEDAYFVGAKVETLFAFAPTAGASLNAALVTMAGQPSIGLTIDPAAVPDPVILTACLDQGFEEVSAAAGAGGASRGRA